MECCLARKQMVHVGTCQPRRQLSLALGREIVRVDQLIAYANIGHYFDWFLLSCHLSSPHLHSSSVLRVYTITGLMGVLSAGTGDSGFSPAAMYAIVASASTSFFRPTAV